MPDRSLCIAVLIVLLLGGCSRLQLFPDDPIVTAEQAIAAADWRQADALLTRMRASPEQQQQRHALQEQVAIRSADYARQAQRKVERLAAAGDWRAAFETLDQAQAALPPHTLPDTLRHSLAQRQQAQRNALHASVLLSEARWLQQQKQSREALATMQDDDALGNL